uniref:Plastocyanin-like domain-containing protein n=1 Tax=Picea sitchensis TaxID=3332 RepID=B8LRY9_PICSI|nr:unknown [Picea sitchensis]
MEMNRCALIFLFCFLGFIVLEDATTDSMTDESLHKVASSLEMFVEELPDMPRLEGYVLEHGKLKPTELRIGMFETKWKFHSALPPTTVFAYGASKETATVPGPTIEAIQGTSTFVRWENHLPSRHFLPWDPTLKTARAKHGGVPTVVHLHGGIHEPESDGNSQAWFTAGFNETGPAWKKPLYHYNNIQHPGNLWYHDHALGFTRANLLAGLIGAYVIRSPAVEKPLGLPSGPEYDRNLLIFDRSFATDGSIYMNSTGNNPSIHPQWQPEYFGDAIIVNGKAWPYLKVKRRKYRFRILNASNARFYRFALSNGLNMTHIGSDSTYIPMPVTAKQFLLGPSELADIVIDFTDSPTGEAILTNDAVYPYPSGDPVDHLNSKVMKFVIESKRGALSSHDESRIPEKLIEYRRPLKESAAHTRYITMYEYESASEEPTHLFFNGLPYDAPATETPRQGTSELWHVIDLTDDNHPLHIHLGLFVVLQQTELLKLDEFKACMQKQNDALRCNVEKHAKGKVMAAPVQERGWKNVFKIQPGYITTILVQFSFLDSHQPYPFNASTEPGYVYHCHILDHEDNEMMRPLKIRS